MTAAIVGIVLALVAAIGAWMRKGGKDAATAKAKCLPVVAIYRAATGR